MCLDEHFLYLIGVSGFYLVATIVLFLLFNNNNRKTT